MNQRFTATLTAELVATCCLAAPPEPVETPAASGCAACHVGLEPIRATESGMMQRIFARGRARGDPQGCVVCHGGDPEASTAEAAHRGPEFYPDPGSPWINEQTCGPCHPRHVGTQWTSLMMTESGKIQGTSWSFGALEGYRHEWGNYDVQNPASEEERVGSEAYRAYMAQRRQREPGAYPDAQTALPPGPTDLASLEDQPELAAFTYIRTECQRCHLAVRGRMERGDYRGMGCSACHIPYSNEGHYEGADPTIPKGQPRHHLVHSIQATREATVTIHGVSYSGVPIETCTTCHDRGKRIGVSFQGLMESAFVSPFRSGGAGQVALHSKHYIALQPDVHSLKGMTCPDCHTSIDVHGDGFIAGTNLAQVQIECTDCHGTPTAFPWELPLGYGDEFGPTPRQGAPRGVTTALPDHLRQGTVYPPEDGYLLTARGNPFPEVVRRGDTVVVHTAGGKDLVLTPLKQLNTADDLEPEAHVAMASVVPHIERMECYACHAQWVPQCYGCHLKIDYSKDQRRFDWVAAGHEHIAAEHRADNDETAYETYVPGKVTEQRSYMRWEYPALGVSGEGRVAPVTTGCQPAITIIGADGETILLNRIFRTPPFTEGAGKEGQLCIDMSPGQPHTIGRARSCESCHGSPKAMGYGIDSGRLSRPWSKPKVVDIMTADERILPQEYQVQIEGIGGLENDWSRFITEDGRQLMTVGHHWSLSRPLDATQRALLDRRGICLACHQEIPKDSLAVSLLHHTAEFAGKLPKTAGEHNTLVHKVLLFTAWVQSGGMVTAPLALMGAAWWCLRRRRRARCSSTTPPGEPDAGAANAPATRESDPQ